MAETVMPGCIVSSTSRTFSSALYRLRRSRPVMISTRSMGFDTGVRLGFHLGPHGCADCPVELGAAPPIDHVQNDPRVIEVYLGR